MTLQSNVLAGIAAVAFLAAPKARAQFINHSDPFWTPNVITGLPPALFPAGWHLPGFGAYYGLVALSPGRSYLCRTNSPYSSTSGWSYGHVYADHCYFAWGGVEHSATGFEMLAGAKSYSWHTRDSYEAFAHSAPTTTEDAQMAEEADHGISRVCRAEVNQGNITGQLREGNCHIAFEGLEIIRPEYEVLRRERR